MGGPGGLVEGFSLIAGLFCLGFGIALIILAQRDSGKPFMLRRDGVVAGVAGAFGTFVLSVIASWGTHEERDHIARSTIQSYASVLELELQSSVALIDRLASAWIFPDPAKPFSAIALVRPDLGSDAYFLAVFDVAELLALESSRDYYDFEIRLEGADSPAVERAIALHHLEHEVYEHVPVNIPNGPDLVLSATADPASVLSLRDIPARK